jgi:hypothetical protein
MKRRIEARRDTERGMHHCIALHNDKFNYVEGDVYLVKIGRSTENPQSPKDIFAIIRGACTEFFSAESTEE